MLQPVLLAKEEIQRIVQSNPNRLVVDEAYVILPTMVLAAFRCWSTMTT